MRIISSFKDYYDGFFASMRDDVTFIRGETKELSSNNGGIDICNNTANTQRNLHVIKFCDQLFPCVNIRTYKGVTIIRNQWSYDETQFPKEFKAMKELKINWPDQPIVSVHIRRYHHDLTIAPKLQDFGFASILPPEQAYQEMYRWLCNKPVEAKKIPTIENDMRILTHGFGKFSFRKEKRK